MSIIKVANVHFETTGTNRIDYGTGFIRVIVGDSNGVVVNVGGTEKINIGSNTIFTSNVVVQGYDVIQTITAASEKANTALPNTSGATFAGNLNITGNVGIGADAVSIYPLEIAGSSNTLPTNGAEPLLSIKNTSLANSAISSILFRGLDTGGTSRHSGAIVWRKTGEWSAGSGNYPADLAFFTRPNNSGDEQERMRIDSNGNVGIGSTNPSTKVNVFGSASGGITTLTDDTSIVIDMTSNNNFAITLGGSNTFINPTVMNPGQSGIIWISQDNNGSRAPSWGSYWKFPGNTAPTLTTAANSVDAIVFVVRNSTSITAQAILNVG